MERILVTAPKGITDDPRSRAVHAVALKNFDTRLLPLRDMEVDANTESDLDTYQITKMLAAGGNFYGFGIEGGGNTRAKVFVKQTTPTAAWAAATNGSDGSLGGARNDLLFVYYRGAIYGGNNSGIWKYVVSPAAFTYNENTTIVATGQGLVHSKDDCLYIPCTNSAVPYIARNNAGSWNNTALQLPNGTTNVSLFEYNNYLGIACNLANDVSVIYLWDRDTSLATVSESISWGTGTLQVAENLGGTIIGVSALAATSSVLQPRVVIRYWDGASVRPLYDFYVDLATFVAVKQKFDNILYFLAEITMNGNAFKGVWRITKNLDGTISFQFDRSPRNDTALSAGSLKGFYRWGDYMHVAYLLPSLAYTISRTNDQASYTATSLWETTINPALPTADMPLQKQLHTFAVTYAPLPSGAQVIGKYRVDGGSWVTVFTETTTGQMITERVRAESADLEFVAGYEYEFHVEATGGAQPTSIIYKVDPLDTAL